MKRFISICSVFLLLSFSMNTIKVFAVSKTFTQGLYLVRDSGLSINSTYKVRNLSFRNPAVLIVFDGNNMMQEFLRLEIRSPEYFIRPLGYDYIIVIIGDAEIEFS